MTLCCAVKYFLLSQFRSVMFSFRFFTRLHLCSFYFSSSQPGSHGVWSICRCCCMGCVWVFLLLLLLLLWSVSVLFENFSILIRTFHSSFLVNCASFNLLNSVSKQVSRSKSLSVYKEAFRAHAHTLMHSHIHTYTPLSGVILHFCPQWLIERCIHVCMCLLWLRWMPGKSFWL